MLKLTTSLKLLPLEPVAPWVELKSTQLAPSYPWNLYGAVVLLSLTTPVKIKLLSASLRVGLLTPRSSYQPARPVSAV